LTSKDSTGPDVPGAYPSKHDDGPDIDLNATAEQVKNAAFGVIDSAKGYLPSREDAGNVASNALGTAREYLPAQEHVMNATRSVMDAARQYLPEQVAAYLRASSPLRNSPVFSVPEFSL
jgi:hypothetical protein